ncbi:fumarylacetoacetate hydrolase family protein [Puniceicoccales bacterium CK1056]|uniref:Fumarylacetoacetate hydrolase family protein n=1 Tax=Oceanipulchritudo coccoides TaxID=2706888 RepID=A0A6B2LXY6_9BACT|nr:fumarylacetoacetate hydrolase family protein [Oceanipulchritudo coccoides]NDV61183.1 fumarylacetoacetate hydrolase family protein [Oceanipulchritudo coccoides]
MKILRTRNESGCIVYLKEISPTEGFLIEGDIFGSFSVSEQRLPIRERLAPVHPPLIIGIAQNYRAHALEMGGDLPRKPVFFLKMPHSLQDPGKPILLPRNLRSDKVDFESELAVIIGKTCRNVSEPEALEHVLGYAAANDVSARDWQKEWGGGQFCRGKGFDTFCPIGPHIVTREDIPDPGKLAIRGYLNDELMQDGHTSDLIFSVPQLIAFLSGSTTLPAGTVILTGTPSGVGAARTPPLYLKAGDRYTVEIESIGKLENPVAEEA